LASLQKKDLYLLTNGEYSKPKIAEETAEKTPLLMFEKQINSKINLPSLASLRWDHRSSLFKGNQLKALISLITLKSQEAFLVPNQDWPHHLSLKRLVLQ
jgi:hypothetical protein